MLMRWTRALVVTLMLVTGCSSGQSDEPAKLRTLSDGDSFTIPQFSGSCPVDFSSQVHGVDPTSGIEWSIDVPWVERREAFIVHRDLAIGASRQWTSADGRHVFALDATSGEPRWQRTVDSMFTPLHAPIPSDDVVIMGDGQSVVGLDVASGSEAWRFTADWHTTPVITEGGLVVQRDNGPLVVLDPETGALRREFPIAVSNRGVGLHVAAGLVLVDDGQGEVAALDPATGAIRWRYDVNLGDQTRYEIAIVDDTVLVTRLQATSGEISALDPETGAVRWKRVIPDLGPIVEMSDLVVDRTSLNVIDVATGRDLWRIEPRSHGIDERVDYRFMVSQPTPDLVVVALPHLAEEQDSDTGSARSRTQNRLLTFDTLDGTVRWQLDVEEERLSPATIVADRMIIGGGRSSYVTEGEDPDKGRLMALDSTTGVIEWETELRDEVASAPIPFGDRAIVLSSEPSVDSCD